MRSEFTCQETSTVREVFIVLRMVIRPMLEFCDQFSTWDLWKVWILDFFFSCEKRFGREEERMYSPWLNPVHKRQHHRGFSLSRGYCIIDQSLIGKF